MTSSWEPQRRSALRAQRRGRASDHPQHGRRSTRSARSKSGDSSPSRLGPGQWSARSTSSPPLPLTPRSHQVRPRVAAWSRSSWFRCSCAERTHRRCRQILGRLGRRSCRPNPPGLLDDHLRDHALDHVRRSSLLVCDEAEERVLAGLAGELDRLGHAPVEHRARDPVLGVDTALLTFARERRLPLLGLQELLRVKWSPPKVPSRR